MRIKNWIRGILTPAVLALLVLVLGFPAPSRAQNDSDSFILIDQQSAVYSTFAVAAGDKIKADKNTDITGDIHSNRDIDLKKGSAVIGNASAVRRAHIRGTVSGVVSEGAEPLILPVLPDEGTLRARADRVFQGNTTFTDAVIDDVIFVDGNARFEGSLNGVGTIIAANDIRIGKEDKVELSAFTLSLTTTLGNTGTLRVTAREGGKKGRVIDVEIVSLDLVGADPIIVDESPGSKDGNLIIDSITATEVQFTLAVEETDKLKKEVELEVVVNEAIFGPVVISTEGNGIPDVGTMVGEFVVEDTTARLKPGFVSVSLATDFEFDPGTSYTMTATLLDGKGKKTLDTETANFLGSELPLDGIDASPGAKDGNLRIERITASEVLLTLEVAEKDKLGKEYQFELVINDTMLGPQKIKTGGKEALNVGQSFGAFTIDDLVPVGEDRTFLSDDTKLSLIAFHNIRIGKDRDFRGVALADRDVRIEKNSVFEGVIVAGRRADIKKKSVVRFLNFSAPEATQVKITSPQNLALFNSSPITISGSVPGGSSVVVNGIQAIVNGVFTTVVPLQEGNNTITAVAEDAFGNVATDSIQVTLDTTPPTVIIDSPPDGFVTSESSITVSGMINDIVVGTVNGDQAQVSVNDISAAVANRSFLVPDVPLDDGANIITASGIDKAGNTVSTSITVFFQALVGERQISLISGNNQSGPIGFPLPDPLVVELNDGDGNKFPGVNVIFKVMENNGTLSNSPEKVRSLAVLTDGDGRAQVRWTLGTRAGAGNNMVDAVAVGFTGMAIFTATALTAPPDKINVDAGNNQVGVVDQPVPSPFVAVVTDEGHNRLANVPVTFTVVQGAGNFGGQPSVTLNTDSDGRSLAVLTLGPNEGFDNNLVDATFPGNLGASAMFVASGLVAGEASLTQVSGVVLDNTNVPIAGVTMSIEGTELVTQTNDQGLFVLLPAPVGHVLLIADGTTANRPGEWPRLEFDMVTVAGQDNTIGMPIFLLPLDVAMGLFVDEENGGVLTLPEVPGFSLTIAAGSATFPDGSKSGVVSVTLVHNDKIPMVPNFGQQPRFIVTIQPAGVHFDPPAPITIPNVDGMAPGEVTELYSFDHDLGQFVSIGTGTVSEDGTIIASDPGVGIIKGGWHCGGNPAQAGGAENAHVQITTADPVTLAKNATTTVSATGGPHPGSFSWTSSNPDVVNITGGAASSTVNIQAVSLGTATLTVTFTCQSGASDSDSIQVIVGPAIDITSISPAGMFELGKDLTINYKVEPPGTDFDTVKMEIKNSNGIIVFKKEGLPVAGGNHTTTWEQGKWNQPPHSGAFANPKNNPYEIKLVGTKDGEEDEDTEPVTTKLVLEADIKDEKPAGVAAAVESAGLADMLDALKIVMKLSGVDKAVISGAGSITVTGANRDEKHIKVQDAALNNLDNGNYDVIARDLRDEIGNFKDDDSNPANGFETTLGTIDLQ